MKKYLLFLAIAAAYCSSCSKENSNGSYYIKATFNGQEKTFSDNPSAAEYSGDLSAGFNMRAEDNRAATEFALNIIHPFGVIITTGEYGDLSNGYVPGGHYRIGDAISYESGVVANASTIHITISGFTATSVSGTFSGWLTNTRDTTASMVLTNGSFNLPVH